MKRGATIFLQFAILLIGIAVLSFMLAEPNFEGRNVHATLFEVYFHDPFLAYAYLGSIPFFVTLYQAFRVLGYIRRTEIFSAQAVRALRTIKYCALLLLAFLAGGEAYFFIVRRSQDDIAGGVMMGLFLMFIAAIIGTAAAVFEQVLQSAVDLKSGNDRTA